MSLPSSEYRFRKGRCFPKKEICDYIYNRWCLPMMRTGLACGTLLSHLLDEPNFGTDRQMVEGVIENTVAVKKDLAAIGGFKNP